jgi:hypothetical protein
LGNCPSVAHFLYTWTLNVMPSAMPHRRLNISPLDKRLFVASNKAAG